MFMIDISMVYGRGLIQQITELAGSFYDKLSSLNSS